jgi:hypothetical protein
VRRVGVLVVAGAIVGAAHVGAHANALVGPAIPLAIGVEADRDLGVKSGSKEKPQRGDRY